MQNNHDKKTDQEILDLFYQDKNNEWLGVLLSRYSLLLFGLCMKYLKNQEDAKDAVQQIFIKVINELSKYQVTYFKSWLYMVAKNYCLMQLRQKKYLSVELNETIYISEENELDINALIKKDKELNTLESAILLLNNEQKLCITLFYLKKNSYLEITEKTGLTMLQVKSFIQNGKRNLKLLIEKQEENDR